MNLEQIIGQLLIIGMEGPSITSSSPIVRDIRKHNLGGVILFDRFLAKKSPDNNIISASQTRQLIDSLQEEAGGSLIVTVDQEGGKVSRFKKSRGFAETLTAEELGNDLQLSATVDAANQTASLLADLGFTLNLAPVADINCNPDNPIIAKYQRSFSTSAEEVTRHAEAWINAHHNHGIRSCLKHFPGHGSATEDSHLGFVDISDSWQEIELFPYQKLTEKGTVDAVMTGHLYNTALDSVYPATLSKKVISDLLRNDIGFSGAVISDDMQMRAITSKYGLDEAVCLALAAGVDLLIFGNNLDYDPNIVPRVITAVIGGIERGTLTEEMIYDRWRRVQLLKQPLTTHEI
ncbi:glycoside hydrolase family 3 N-terminal domain-containing protein [Desulfosediminicola flagellatus]|uniref:glycoside hydrolase family 3 N-terminal domain-containing protein n=1 Tax=Desulfosediminicola flagellatus TaxID=2569541 RepID=UPI0010ACEF07|nr:glycoside hydrolase family 3 N-terminal domain-containing protein [Desulfosediminicola flagellatus]